jgi:arsenate reductase
MAEGLLRADFGNEFTVESAGTRATEVRPEAIAVMQEIGIDISGHRSKVVDVFADEAFDAVLTVCDSAREACPIYPGHGRRVHHSFTDPAAASGSEEDRLAAFRRVRDEIRDFLPEFVRFVQTA